MVRKTMQEIKVLAEAAGISSSRVRQLIRDGVIAAEKDDGRWYVEVSEAERWLEERKEDADSDSE